MAAVILAASQQHPSLAETVAKKEEMAIILLVKSIDSANLGVYLDLETELNASSTRLSKEFGQDMWTFVQLFFQRYFDVTGFAIKGHIMAALLEVGAAASQGERIASVLQECGPAMQKLFQLLGDHIESNPDLKKASQKLKSNIKRMNAEQLHHQLKRAGDITHRLHDLNSKSKSAMAASVAQGHFVDEYEPPQGDDAADCPGEVSKVFVKGKRPGLRAKLTEEMRVFGSIVNDFKDTYGDHLHSLRES